MDRYCQWDEVLVVFDPPEGSLYRKSIYTDYKANRVESDPDLKRQLSLLPGLLPSFGFSTLMVPGVETDDVIGSLAERLKKKGAQILIVTPDKDMAQLVDESVGLLKPLKGEVGIKTPFDYLDIQGVINTFGVSPELIPDWLALIGDVSDNIPGIKGVGPKTATKLLNEYGDIRTLMTHTGKLKPSLKATLESGRDYFEISLKLTTIQRHLNVSEFVVNKGVFNHEKVRDNLTFYQMPLYLGEFNFIEDSLFKE